MNFKRRTQTRMFLAVTLICLFSLSMGLRVQGEEGEEYPADQYVVENFNTQWVANPDFSGTAGDTWSQSIEGDSTDVFTSLGSDHAEFMVHGENGTYGNFNSPPINDSWSVFPNPAFPIWPNERYEIDDYGFTVEHDWNEQIAQQENTPSVQWKQNVTVPVDMSDYTITNASVASIINATVNADIDTPWDGLLQGVVYDYVRFYVLLEDVPGDKQYEIAYYRTRTLGNNSNDQILTLADTPMNTVSEEVLKFFLTSVLETDGNNFVLTVGFNIYCEDNIAGTDRDRWDDLRINSVNLTFDYEKKVNQFTTADWYSVGDTILGQNVQILNATMGFDYKINDLWTSNSPNSELIIAINNNTLSETVKLSTANITYKAAKETGFDVTNLILMNVNITPHIRLSMADTFLLDTNYTISIDNVYLTIGYRTVTPIYVPPAPEGTNLKPFIYSLVGVIGALSIGFIAYQTYFKYPVSVRKLHKLRREIKYGKRINPVMLKSPIRLFRDKYENLLSGYNFRRGSGGSSAGYTPADLGIKGTYSKPPLDLPYPTPPSVQDRAVTQLVQAEKLHKSKPADLKKQAKADPMISELKAKVQEQKIKIESTPAEKIPPTKGLTNAKAALSGKESKPKQIDFQERPKTKDLPKKGKKK